MRRPDDRGRPTPLERRRLLTERMMRDGRLECELCGRQVHITCGVPRGMDDDHAIVGHLVDLADGGSIWRDGWRVECRKCSNRGGQNTHTRYRYGRGPEPVTLPADDPVESVAAELCRVWTATAVDDPVPTPAWVAEVLAEVTELIDAVRSELGQAATPTVR